MNTDTADRWQAAFDARERAVRAHPLYPTLFRKVARYEVYVGMTRPISRRYRNAPYEINWRRSLITHPETPVQSRVLEAAYGVARRMLDDVFPDRWPSEGDMLAAITGPARNDVRARVDGRQSRSGNNDLPAGYRWAREDEMDREDAIVVPRTGQYTQGEADLAVPVEEEVDG